MERRTCESVVEFETVTHGRGARLNGFERDQKNWNACTELGAGFENRIESVTGYDRAFSPALNNLTARADQPNQLIVYFVSDYSILFSFR
jgi:hypothetical protein